MTAYAKTEEIKSLKAMPWAVRHNPTGPLQSFTPSTPSNAPPLIVQQLVVLSVLFTAVLVVFVQIDRVAHRLAFLDAAAPGSDIGEFVAQAGFYNISNRMVSATDMYPNPEYHAKNR